MDPVSRGRLAQKKPVTRASGYTGARVPHRSGKQEARTIVDRLVLRSPFQTREVRPFSVAPNDQPP